MKPQPSKILVAVARLENQAAPPVWSRTGPPRPVMHRPHPEAHGAWQAPPAKAKPQGTLKDPALVKAFKAATPFPWQAPEPAAPVFAWKSPAPVFTDETVIRLKFHKRPPEFKTLKKGPRAGQTVEIMGVMKLVTRTVADGDGVAYSFTSRSSAVKVSTGVTLTPAQVRATFARRWPAKAAELAAFLLME